MKISPAHLFDAGGISCFHLRENPETGRIDQFPACAVFVIEETVSACRERDSSVGSLLQEVAYGDILVTWRDSEGRVRGQRSPGGRDAALAVTAPPGSEGRLLPFTGENMFEAWSRLSEAHVSGRDLDPSHRRVLFSIEGLFRMIQGNTEPERFPENVIGAAYKAVFANRRHNVHVDVSDSEFALLCIAKTLRARIGGIDPQNPDALVAAVDHDDILSALGIDTIGGRRGSRLTPSDAFPMAPAVLRSVIAAVSSAPQDRLGVSRLDGRDADLLLERAAGEVLSGDWVDMVQDMVSDGIGGDVLSGIPGSGPDVALLSVKGRDLLVLQDPDPGQGGLVWSWPSADRRTLVSLDGRMMIAVSPEEIPERSEIDRLQAIFHTVARRAALEAVPDNG